MPTSSLESYHQDREYVIELQDVLRTKTNRTELQEIWVQLEMDGVRPSVLNKAWARVVKELKDATRGPASSSDGGRRRKKRRVTRRNKPRRKYTKRY